MPGAELVGVMSWFKQSKVHLQSKKKVNKNSGVKCRAVFDCLHAL